MRLTPSKSGPIRIEEVADKASLSAEDLDSQRIRQGFGLAWGLIALIGLVLVLVAIYAVATYPDIGSARAYFGRAASPSALRDLRDSWFSQIKDLLQLLVVSLLVPLLATLIGYIFGRQSSAGD